MSFEDRNYNDSAMPHYAVRTGDYKMYDAKKNRSGYQPGVTVTDNDFEESIECSRYNEQVGSKKATVAQLQRSRRLKHQK